MQLHLFSFFVEGGQIFKVTSPLSKSNWNWLQNSTFPLYTLTYIVGTIVKNKEFLLELIASIQPGKQILLLTTLAALID